MNCIRPSSVSLPALLSFLQLVIGTPAFGAEVFHLTNGFSIEASGHVTHAETVSLNTSTGTIDFPLDLVAGIDSVPVLSKSLPPADKPLTRLVDDPLPALVAAADIQGLESALITSVAIVESGLNGKAISPRGAIGLMQLMPGTARELEVQAEETTGNALGGAKYLRKLLIQYKGNYVLALAAYNAGPGAVSKYGGVPPFEETRNYILRVLKEYNHQKRQTMARNSTAARTPSATN